jgi:hypothetical protein
MASFCTNCGTPVIGQFCTKCGAAIQEAAAQSRTAVPPANPAPQGAPPPPQAVRTSSGIKILLVVLAGLLLLGAVGVAGIVYVGVRAKQKIQELKNDYGIESEGASGTAASSIRKFPPSQGSGCKMLEGQEAAQILGVAVERAEFDPNGPSGTLFCKYWVSASERQRLIKEEIGASVAAMGKADTKSGQMDIENLLGGAAGALNEANGGNKDSEYAFSLQVWQKNGKEQWEKMESAQARTKDAAGADVAAVAMQSVQGIGDRAIELPAGHSIMVLKGDTFFLLGFQQFVPGRDKTAALARVVAGRI